MIRIFIDPVAPQFAVRPGVADGVKVGKRGLGVAATDVITVVGNTTGVLLLRAGPSGVFRARYPIVPAQAHKRITPAITARMMPICLRDMETLLDHKNLFKPFPGIHA
jgi:hypothetical protein